MVVAGLWKRKDIDALEASLYRKILFLSRGISNKAILNTIIELVLKEKLYIPRVMAKMMLATTSNSTSIHFGLDHMCRIHNVLFTMEHVEARSEIRGFDDIRK